MSFEKSIIVNPVILSFTVERLIMSLPGVLLLSLIVGYQTFAWIGTLLVQKISRKNVFGI
ncbi:hypothetical protein CHY_0616 [Carboxydothermus hydrogenoformans Z-2901]|uniref:Uncharacterized protein n=1 Tax=Carboxydothermus hydrogenoformans (strain ATCC BAA-161 / DSM 6008 / Z-2901) TaxID=246194 RepID=Q3AEG2_CARHZ|nr:hypothetical protein CHY_0616 [Carboxydothermus hydrogenoformans Z-2901]